MGPKKKSKAIFIAEIAKFFFTLGFYKKASRSLGTQSFVLI
jgi:hypothetical protein